MKNGQVKSCGCFARDSLRAQGIKNGIEKGHIINTTLCNKENLAGKKPPRFPFRTTVSL